MDVVAQAEDLMRQAGALMTQAERLNLKHPETMTNCSQAFVLYARAVYLLLGLDFPERIQNREGWSIQEGMELLAEEVSRLSSVSLPMLFPYRDDLPRVIVLAAFWSTFAGFARAACRKADIGPGTVFAKDEAGCAVSQARQCHKMVKSLIDLKK